jgi:hypothetical protein
MRSFYQDRLGTNIRKTLKKRWRFLTGLRQAQPRHQLADATTQWPRGDAAVRAGGAAAGNGEASCDAQGAGTGYKREHETAFGRTTFWIKRSFDQDRLGTSIGKRH